MRYAASLKRNAAVLIGCLMVAVVTVGCAGNGQPQLSPEGQAAVQGRAVVKAADAVVTGIDNAMTAKQLPVNIGRQVLLAIRQVGVQGQTLADALAVVDAAKTTSEKQKGLDAARAALATIQATLVGAVSPITDPATKTQVDALLKGLTDAVLKVQQLVAGASSSTDAPPAERAKRLLFDRQQVPAWATA